MYMYIYIYIHIDTHTHTCASTCACSYARICLSTNIPIYLTTSTYLSIYLFNFVYL